MTENERGELTEDERRELEFHIWRCSREVCHLSGAYEDLFDSWTPEQLAELKSHIRVLDMNIVNMDSFLKEDDRTRKTPMRRHRFSVLCGA
jgi:hypothetical protein